MNTKQKKNYELYLLSAIVAIIIAIIGIAIRAEKNRCKCVKFKKFTELTIYPNGEFDSTEDSICVVSGNKNGELVIKRF